MEHINVLGYFKESEVVTNYENEKLLYFVAFENSYNDVQLQKNWIEGFNVIDGHFTLKDKKYLISCEMITKEEYLKATNGYSTPEAYL